MCSWKPPCSASTPITGASLLVTVATAAARLVTVRTSVIQDKRAQTRHERGRLPRERITQSSQMILGM